MPFTIVHQDITKMKADAIINAANAELQMDGRVCERYSKRGGGSASGSLFIDSWAVEATKYMSKLGIIKGDANGNFMPKATNTAEQAAGYGTATREAAVLMTVRTYDVMD